MKFYGLNEKEVRKVKAFNDEYLGGTAVKAFKSNSSTITIECKGKTVTMPLKTLRVDKANDNCITFAELDDAITQKGFEPFIGKFDRNIVLGDNIKPFSNDGLENRIKERKRLLVGLSVMQKVEEEYNKVGKKLNAFSFDGQHTLKKDFVKISIERRDLCLTYNAYSTAINEDSFNFNKLIDRVKRDIQRLKEELELRNSHIITSPKIVEIVKGLN